jgi:hypothetical protein
MFMRPSPASRVAGAIHSLVGGELPAAGKERIGSMFRMLAPVVAATLLAMPALASAAPAQAAMAKTVPAKKVVTTRTVRHAKPHKVAVHTTRTTAVTKKVS